MYESAISVFGIWGLVGMTLLALHSIVEADKADRNQRTKKKIEKFNKDLKKLEDDVEKFLADKSKPILKLHKKEMNKLWHRVNKLDNDKTINVGQFEDLSKISGKLSALKKKIEKHI